MSKSLRDEGMISQEASSPLLNLPTEIHLQISTNLPYPDALALKHTNTHFYFLTTTNVKLKVAWLISRHERRLPCPSHKCILKTDAQFCTGTNGEVTAIMERRRKHKECKFGKGGCEVVIGGTCEGPKFTVRERLEQCANRMEPWIGRVTYWAVAALVFSIAFNIYLVMRANETTYGVLTAGGGHFVSGS